MDETKQTRRNPKVHPKRAPLSIDRIRGPGIANVCILFYNRLIQYINPHEQCKYMIKMTFCVFTYDH